MSNISETLKKEIEELQRSKNKDKETADKMYKAVIKK